MEYIRKVYQLSIIGHKAINVFGGSKFQFITIKFLVPFIQIAFFALIAQFAMGKEYMEYVVVGNAVHIMTLSTIIGVVTSIARDREIGTLYSVFMSPINSVTFFISRIILHCIEGVLTSLIAFIIASLFFGITLSFETFILIAVLLLIISISLAGFGVLLGSIAIVYHGTLSIANIFTLFLLFVSGVNFPVEKLPIPLFYLSQLFPITHGLEVVRQAINGEEISSFKLLITIFIGLVYLGLSILLYKGIEELARRNSSIELD